MMVIKNFITKNKNILLGILVIMIISILFLISPMFSKKELEEDIKKEEYTLVLIGDQTISIYQGDPYFDLGCRAYDQNQVDVSNKLIVNNYVDSSQSGTYKVIYSIIENGKMKSIEREVIVKDSLGINLSYDISYTNQDLLITIDAKGSDFSYIILPDQSRIYDILATYTISLNGTYKFYVYDNFGNYVEREIVINNIDKEKPKATCKANSYFDRTEILVDASDEVGIANYVYNKEYQSSKNNYVINKKLDKVSVGVFDLSGNVNDIDCEIIDHKLEMHFIAGISDDDAILIRTNDKTIMIDGGQYNAKDKIVNYLKDLGVTKIDALIGSHVHWNHVQTHAAILEHFEVDDIYYSVDIINCISLGHCAQNDNRYIKDKLISMGKKPTILKAKDKIVIGDMTLYTIGPVRGELTTYQNANSLVFILTYGNNKFMLTGDTPSKYMDTEKFLANANYFGLDLKVDVFKFPHHGYEKISDELFKAMTPKYAIIPNCCSCTTIYPSAHNKDLMEKYNVSYYQVCSGKNIVLTSDGNDIVIKTNQQASDYKR